MKTLLSFALSILLLIGTAVPGFSVTNAVLSNAGDHPILIVQDTTNIPDAPRSPVSHPFFAELMNGYVLLEASYFIGTVSVQITSTAGDDYSTYFDTDDGAIVLPISGNTGYYTLRITTPAGEHFIGEFSL